MAITVKIEEKLTKYYLAEMTRLYCDSDYSLEQPEDKQAWIAYLQSQIGALK